MMELVATISLSLLAGAAFLAFWRLFQGPTVPDRTIAFDMLAICIVAVMVLISILWETRLFIEIMLIFSLLGFVGTVAFVSYLLSNPSKLLEEARSRPEEDT